MLVALCKHTQRAVIHVQRRGCASSSATSIAQKLWNDRLKHKSENSTENPSLPYDATAIKPKSVSESMVQVRYPLTSDELFRKEYLRFDGGLRFGNMLEDMDAVTGSCAYFHCHDGNPNTKPLHIVTASVSHVSFRRFLPTKRTLFDLTMTGKIKYVGKSSMLIGVEIAEAGSLRDGSLSGGSLSDGASAGTNQKTIVEADFVMVARDTDTGKAAHINPLGNLSEAEQVAFDSGFARIQKEKLDTENHLDTTVPTEDEIAYIHCGLYKARELHSIEGRLNSVLSNYTSVENESAAGSLNGKRFSIGSTMLQNVVLCQPQDQNTAGKIFGGFLMKHAYTVSYCNLRLFLGALGIKDMVRIVHVDDITFLKPVEIGNIITFTSHIVYAQGRFIQVQVDAEVHDVES